MQHSVIQASQIVSDTTKTICVQFALVFGPKHHNEDIAAVPHLEKVANNFVWILSGHPL